MPFFRVFNELPALPMRSLLLLFAASWVAATTAQEITVEGGRPKMDPYLRRLFSSPNDSRLVDGLFKRICMHRSDGGDVDTLSVLSDEHRTVLDVSGCEGLVGNGGFEYLFTSGLVDIPGIADSYDRIGAKESAAALRQALTVFPNSTPHLDIDKRQTHIYELDEDASERLDQLANDFYEFNREVLGKLASYVRSRQKAFVGLPPTDWEDINDLIDKDLPPPEPYATKEAVAKWIRSIDGASEDLESCDRHRLGLHVKQSPGGENPIVYLRFSQQRYSTDSELEAASRIIALYAF